MRRDQGWTLGPMARRSPQSLTSFTASPRLEVPSSSRRSNASPSSTTTARCGARSRCRSSSASSCSAWRRMARARPVAADAAAVEGRLRQGLRVAGRGHHQALSRRRQRREGADRRHPQGVRGHVGRRLLRRTPSEFLRTAQHPTLKRALPRLRLPADGRAAALSRGHMASRPTSPRAATATSCAR